MRQLKPARVLVGSVTAAAVVMFSAGPAAAAVTPATGSAGAAAIASAIAAPATNVTGASYQTTTGGTPNGTSDGLDGFPTQGGSFGILTTGNVAFADDPNSNVPDNSSYTDDKSQDNNGLNVPGRGNTASDITVLKVDLDVPAGANCLTLDFKFFSEEFREYVNTDFNDAFIAELDTSSWTTSGSTITAPNNFAFGPDNKVISINTTGNTAMNTANASGTTYDGATPLLSASKQVTPGAHSLYLSIFDQGDRILDSAVFLDNLVVGFVPDPETQCVPGAQPKLYELSLSPESGTGPVGTTHEMTAKLAEIGGAPTAGVSVLFQVSGAHSTGGSDATDAAGVAEYSYSGTTMGSDTIFACADLDSSGTCTTGEPTDSATKEWVNAPPVAEAGGPYSGQEGSAIPLDGSGSSDPDGDPLHHAWAIDSSGLDAGGLCTLTNASSVTPSLTCDDDGFVVLRLTTTDPHGASSQDTADVFIGNVAPAVGAVTVPVAPVPVGSSVNASAPYSDAGGNDSHTAVWTWDDGSSSPGSAGGGSASGSHVYSAPGIYTVCVTVHDDEPEAGSACATDYVVVYDPNAGFVTGGGWINSPAGAYTPADPDDEDVVGRANFGFVSKYRKGATTPTGSTEFQFKAGDLNFHSDVYEWLVVSGAKATYKGSGTVNGTSGYKFMLSAVDGGRAGGGGTDKFRIKIWNAATNAVLYDNQAGASDDATATTVISGGSIVIHT